MALSFEKSKEIPQKFPSLFVYILYGQIFRKNKKVEIF